MMGLLVDSLKYGNGKDLWNVSKTDGATFTKVKRKKTSWRNIRAKLNVALFQIRDCRQDLHVFCQILDSASLSSNIRAPSNAQDQDILSHLGRHLVQPSLLYCLGSHCDPPMCWQSRDPGQNMYRYLPSACHRIHHQCSLGRHDAHNSTRRSLGLAPTCKSEDWAVCRVCCWDLVSSHQTLGHDELTPNCLLALLPQVSRVSPGRSSEPRIQIGLPY